MALDVFHGHENKVLIMRGPLTAKQIAEAEITILNQQGDQLNKTGQLRRTGALVELASTDQFPT